MLSPWRSKRGYFQNKFISCIVQISFKISCSKRACAEGNPLSTLPEHWPSKVQRHPQKTCFPARVHRFRFHDRLFKVHACVQKENICHSWPCHPMLGVIFTNLFCTKVNSVKLWRSTNIKMEIECGQRPVNVFSIKKIF